MTTTIASHRPAPRPVLLAALTYGAASFAHFLHNAVYLDAYPNLPEEWTGWSVMAAWLPIAAVGITGIWLDRRGHGAGLLLLALFAISGYAGLLHFALAPMSAHSVAMHCGIWAESIAGSFLLVAVASTWRRRRGP